MKRHILRLPKKARLHTVKEIEIEGVWYRITLHTYGNQNGFVHFVELRKNWELIADAKSQYYNRTWERFSGETTYKDCLNFAIKSRDITKEIKAKIIEELN